MNYEDTCKLLDSTEQHEVFTLNNAIDEVLVQFGFAFNECEHIDQVLRYRRERIAMDRERCPDDEPEHAAQESLIDALEHYHKVAMATRVIN